MKRVFPSFWLPLVLLLVSSPVSSTSYVMMKDEDLLRLAPIILRGRIVEVTPSPAERPATDYFLEIERVLKGFVPGSNVVVRVLGGVREDGRVLWIWGAPRFKAEEQVLLFLEPHEDGVYRVFQFLLGAFHQVDKSGRSLAVRHLSEAHEMVPRPQGSGWRRAEPHPPEAVEKRQARDFEAFSQWLEDTSLGMERQPDYFVEAPGSGEQLQEAAEPFTFLGGGTTPNFRWFEFDSAGTVTFHAHQSGVAGMTNDEFAIFQSSLQAWNDDPGSNINLVYGGTTTATGGFVSLDGVNGILWDDPNNEISGSYSCGLPGVLAIGGVSGVAGSATFNGDTVWVIGEGDVVTQNGAGCFFDGFGGENGEATFGHEVGHALGIGHSCGDAGSGPCDNNPVGDNDAMMRAFVQSDGRGALLGIDDQGAAALLYPGAGGPPPGPPADPSSLTATALSMSEIQLTWQDNSDNEDDFRVEAKTTGSYAEITTVAADATGVTLSGLSSGTQYTVRVRACNSDGCSGYSNEDSATTSTPPPAVSSAFYTLTPCRVVDTRDANGPYGGPALSSGLQRIFDMIGQCGIPGTAKTVSVNVTVVNPTAAGFLTFFPGDLTPPLASTINFAAGQVRANGAVLALATDASGRLGVATSVLNSGQVHLIIDVNGYFE